MQTARGISRRGKMAGTLEAAEARITSWRQKELDIPTNEQVVLRTLVEIGEIHECCLQLDVDVSKEFQVR